MLSSLPRWNPFRRPPAGLCPRSYCFAWREAGDWAAPGMYGSEKEALADLQPDLHGHCGCPVGLCTRLDPLHGDGDYYEPEESALAASGLPWSYFLTAENLMSETRSGDTPWNAPPRGRTVPLQGMEMYFEMQGEGIPLLLLHGFTGAGSNWSLIFPEPPEGYQLIIPDLRGHGRSTNPSGEFTHRQSALDVLALLDTLEIETFLAIGASAGAETLLHMASRQPDRIRSMVLVSAAPSFPPQARALMRRMTEDKRSEGDWLQMRQWHHHGDMQIRKLWRQGNAFAESYDDMNFTAEDLAALTPPTLLVHGDRDPLYPVSSATEMYAALPKAWLWVVPGGGHVPIFGKRSRRFAETAMGFLGGDLESV